MIESVASCPKLQLDKGAYRKQVKDYKPKSNTRNSAGTTGEETAMLNSGPNLCSDKQVCDDRRYYSYAQLFRIPLEIDGHHDSPESRSRSLSSGDGVILKN